MRDRREDDEHPVVIKPVDAGPTSDDRTPAGDLDGADVCQLVTTGQGTERLHRIEIWFAHRGDTVYVLSGSGTASDWVRNLVQTPEVTLQVGHKELRGRGRIVREPAEDRLARDLLYRKYNPRYPKELEDWRNTALPVAVDLKAA